MCYQVSAISLWRWVIWTWAAWLPLCGVWIVVKLIVGTLMMHTMCYQASLMSFNVGISVPVARDLLKSVEFGHPVRLLEAEKTAWISHLIGGKHKEACPHASPEAKADAATLRWEIWGWAGTHVVFNLSYSGCIDSDSGNMVSAISFKRWEIWGWAGTRVVFNLSYSGCIDSDSGSMSTGTIVAAWKGCFTKTELEQNKNDHPAPNRTGTFC
ncbi:hypothetical protein B0H11DRAFT_1906335 [Mycena galericulata]|nr:hypothetical protein B0H11DRAFT_1906335 [Mycena galericulata]